MKSEGSSGAPFEEGPNPRLFPRINQLAKISFCIGIGDIVVGIYMFFIGLEYDVVLWWLIALFLTSVFGAFCGHCACKQIRTRRPHQTGKGMAVFGLIGCYVCIGLFFLGFLLLSHGTV